MERRQYALRRGLTIVHPLTDEPLGVRRFFVQDPSGNVINCLVHKSALADLLAAALTLLPRVKECST